MNTRQTKPDTRAGLLERARITTQEMERLGALRDAAVRDRDNAVKLSALAVLAIPAFVLWGWLAALSVVVLAMLLVVGTWYITGVHILEYGGNLLDCEADQRVLQEQLAQLEGAGQAASAEQAAGAQPVTSDGA
jgi:hypothetical protein